YSIAAGRQAAVNALLEGFAPAVIAPNPPPEAKAIVSASDVDAHINHLITDLSATSAGVSPETVTGIVRDSYTALARSAKITRYLVPLTERFAKQRLADITRDRASAPPQVLFICVANAGRSQLAAALTRQLSGGRVIARSAGSTPAAGLNSNVAELIRDIDGESVEEMFPKPLTDDAIRAGVVAWWSGVGRVVGSSALSRAGSGTRIGRSATQHWPAPRAWLSSATALRPASRAYLIPSPTGRKRDHPYG